MFLQNTVFIHTINFWLALALIIILISFTISTMLTYSKYKHKAALIISLSYLNFVVAMFFHLIGHWIVMINGDTNTFYFQLTNVANIFIEVGIILTILFYEQLAKIKPIWRNIACIVGIGILAWIMLPFNFDPTLPEYARFKPVTYIIMAIYGYIVYISLTTLYFKAYKKEKQSQLLAMALGSLMFLVYFVLITVYGALQLDAFSIISIVVLFLAFMFYFIGIYLPKLKSRKNPENK